MSPKNEQIVDFNQAREQKMDEKRRKAERIFFQQMLGVYCVTENSNLKSLEIVEVSEEGLSFQVPFDSKNPWPGDSKDISIRLYFSQETYLPVLLNVKNSRSYIEKGSRYVRYGCSINTEMSSYEAYKQFVRFLKSYAEHAHKDKGENTVFYL